MGPAPLPETPTPVSSCAVPPDQPEENHPDFPGTYEPGKSVVPNRGL